MKTIEQIAEAAVGKWRERYNLTQFDPAHERMRIETASIAARIAIDELRAESPVVELGDELIENAWKRFERDAVHWRSGKIDVCAKAVFSNELRRVANMVAQSGSKPASTDDIPAIKARIGAPRAIGGVVGSGESDFNVRVRKGYDGLLHILVKALDQAQAGKGAERHNLGGDIPFERQRMQQISELIGSVDGMTYQACKKITEGVKLPTLERQTAELLGAINYIAGMIIFLQGTAESAEKPIIPQPQPARSDGRLKDDDC